MRRNQRPCHKSSKSAPPKKWVYGAPRMVQVHTKFSENWSSASKFEMGDTQTTVMSNTCFWSFSIKNVRCALGTNKRHRLPNNLIPILTYPLNNEGLSSSLLGCYSLLIGKQWRSCRGLSLRSSSGLNSPKERDGNMLLRNVCNDLSDHTASHSGRLHSSPARLWESKISHRMLSLSPYV